MNIGILVAIGITIAIVGFMVGAASIVMKERDTPTKRPERTFPSQPQHRPSRNKIFLPMLLLLGSSLLMLIFGYKIGNFVLLAVGFLLLFLSFGLLGAFFFNKIY